MPSAAVTAARNEAADPPERVAEGERDGEVVGPAHEVEPAQRGERRAGEQCPGQPAEEDEADGEVGDEAQVAARIVLPAERHEERFGADQPAEQQRPHGCPELVLGDAEALAVTLEPEHRRDAACGGEHTVRAGHHAARPARGAPR